MVSFDIHVRVPTAARARVQFDESNPTLDEAARQQAILTEGGSVRVVEAVELFGSVGFLGQIHGFRPARLHLIGELVSANASLEFGVAGIPGREPLVQLFEKIQLAALLFVGCAGGWFQMQDGRIALAELRPLVSGRQKSRAPVLWTSDRLFVVEQNHE